MRAAQPQEHICTQLPCWRLLRLWRKALECARTSNVWSVISRRPELLIFTVLLSALNAPVLFGSCHSSLIFQPEAVREGEWWRLLTHPFIHLTWYHLLLDGLAFLILYHSLIEKSLLCRIMFLLAGAAGSLLCSWNHTGSGMGLCGLSGVAHGLMAVSALELLGRSCLENRIGIITFSLVVAKAIFEAVTGRMFFGFLEFGLLGQPVAISHAGGIIGSLFAFLMAKVCSPLSWASVWRRRDG